MSYNNAQFTPPFETFSNDHLAKQQLQGFPTIEDIPAPAPDLFESELDFTLAGFDQAELQVLAYDSSDAFSYLRSDTPTCGPPSAITASSESLSAYDDRSSQSESVYSYSPSCPSNSSYFPFDLAMNFQKFGVDDYAAFSTPHNVSHTIDPSSFGTLPPTPPRSPELPTTGYESRSSFSDYGPSPRKISADYYSPSPPFAPSPVAQSTVSPSHVSAQLSLPAIPLARSDENTRGTDPRKKYRCSVCQRAFARAFNLKTHMNTHDPNRPKPHVCPHRSCGRSFSRKHDLGRHLVSIHRDESVCSSHHSTTSKKSIGVDRQGRSWCDTCGKGFIGVESACDCHDVK